MKEASSEAKNHAALAMSDGSVTRLIGSISSSLRSLSFASAPFPMLASSLNLWSQIGSTVKG